MESLFFVNFLGVQTKMQLYIDRTYIYIFVCVSVEHGQNFGICIYHSRWEKFSA